MKGKIEKIKALAPMQEGMLFHSLSNKSAYFEQVSFALKGDVDKKLLEKSIEVIIKRHEILRTVFLYKTLTSAKQVVLTKRSFKLLYEDISSYSDKEAYIKLKNEEERQHPFNLEEDLLIRFKLYKLNPKDYVLVWSYHHIILDGWSTAKIIYEILVIYNNLDKGIEYVNQLLGEPTPYSCYIDWIQKQDKNKAEDFWSNYLDGYQNKIDLTLWKKSTNSKKTYSVKDLYFVIDDSLAKEIREFSNKHQVTLNQLFQTLWGVFLQKYFNTYDVVFGSVVSGRPIEIKNVEEIIGLFINTIPVRIKREPNMTFVDLLEKTRFESRLAENYSYLSLADIQNKSSEKEGLIQTLFIFQNYPKSEVVDENLKFSIEGLDFYEEINYDFNIIIANNDKLVIRFNFNANLFDEDIVREIQQRFIHLTKYIVRNEDEKLNSISILLEGEQEEIIQQGETFELPQVSLLDVLKTNSETLSKHIAIQYLEKKMDYQTLYKNIKNWSFALSENGVKPGDNVAILVNPSIEWVVAVYSILGVGATFVPIDPTYPTERINYILQDSKVKCVITDKLEKELSEDTKYMHINTLNSYQSPDDFELCQRNESDVSYIIYTSGSTGVPKGVQVTDRSLKNLVYWHIQKFNVTAKDRATKLAGLGFDASVWEMFPYITEGATLHIIDNNKRLDFDYLCSYLNNHEITMMFLPTALYDTFVEYDVDSLKYLFVGGEKLNNYYPKNYKLVNNYGPTENTVVTTSMIVEKNEFNIPIGKPIANQKVFIVDHDDLLQPIGAPGEIWVSGMGVSKGYWNKENLTAEKFQSSPWENDERIYKTGDFGRFLPNGNIQYLGRIDQQVKIRGFRIENGEIEKVLKTHFNVKDAVVTVKEIDGNKYLKAYVISRDGEEIEKGNLIKYLGKYLPEYMIPNYYYFILSIPLTANGKIDYQKLEQITINENQPSKVIPLTDFEESVAQIWRDVLGIKEVNIHDHFFDLGGHSIRAMQLVANIRKTLQVDFSINDVYSTPVFKDMCTLLMKAIQLEQCDIPKAEDQPFYPVSSSQEAIFVASDMDKCSTHYNMPFVFELKGNVNVETLEKALQKLIERHEILRTSFGIKSDQIVQIVNKPFKVSINTLCWKDQSPEQVMQLIRKWIKPFDFSSKSLLRVELAELSAGRMLLLIDIHHIIFDGLSMDIFMKEWVDLYRGQPLEIKKLQFRDYANWEKSEEGKKYLKKAEDYWLKEMEGLTTSQSIPTDWIRPVIQNFEGDRIQFSIPEDIYKGLKILSKQNNVTLFTTLLTLYSIIICKYSNQNDIVIGTPFSGRTYKDVEDMIGMFVNVLPIRIRLNESAQFEKILQQVQKKLIVSQEHQIYPFKKIVQNLKLDRDIGQNPIFTTVFSYRKRECNQSSEINFGDFLLKPTYFENPTSKFDLSLNGLEHDSALSLEIEYSTALYKKETVQKIYDVFIELSKQVIKNPQSKISELSTLLHYEKILIDSLNETAKCTTDKDTTFLDLFENICKRHPKQPALIHGKRTLTYEELNIEANKWANYLVKMGAKSNDHIAIFTTATFEYVIAQLATLKIGAVFIPIDPEVPISRMEFILIDANASYIMTNKDVQGINYNGVVIDMKNTNLIESSDVAFEKVSPESLAYIIYTSGSTGQPKGVLIKHSSLVELIDWHISTFKTSKEDRGTKLSGLAFDASILEIYPLLSVGASLYFIDKDLLLETENLNTFLEDNKITLMFLPTPLYQEFSRVDNKSLRYLLVGGEKLNHFTPRSYKLVNNYGPTENTVVATSYLVEKFDKDIPIGKPIGRTKLYILNHHNQLQSIGFPGEICLTGPALSVGYYGRDKLTKEKFVTSPFNKDEILYKTGDYGKIGADGEVYYLGRIDNQIKINGNRVEIGEIEVCLKQLPIIQDAVVDYLTDEDNRTRLHCYVIATDCDEEKIKTHLSSQLPIYMIPSKFIFVDRFPLTLNGKIDYAKLRELSRKLKTTKLEVSNFNDPVTEKIDKIWKEILDLEVLSYEDNLFYHGGNSIDASLILSKVNKLFNTQIRLKDFLVNPTISSLSECVKNSKKVDSRRMEIDLTVNKFPLTSYQKYMYKFSKGNTYLNTPLAFELKGNIDIKKLNQAFELLINKHEILRTSIIEDGGELYHFVHSDIDFSVEQIELKEGRIEQLVQSFDFTKPPLMRVKIVKTMSNKTYLFFDIHHIIFDGYSMNVLFKDLQLAYKGELSTVPAISFKEYVLTEKWKLEKKLLDHERDFWLRKYRDSFSPLELPLDFERPNELIVDGKLIFSRIDGELYKDLIKFIKTKGYSTFTVLLAFYYVCLYRWANWENPIVGTYTAGRANEKFKHTIGLFTNTIPLKIHIEGESKFDDLLKTVHEEILECFNHQEYPFYNFISELPYSFPENRTELFDTMFVLQNMGFPDVKLGDIKAEPIKMDITVSTSEDIYLAAVEAEDHIHLEWGYNGLLFKEETVLEASQCFIEVIEKILKNPNITLKELNNNSFVEL